MKVEVKEPKKFNPITITLETEAEYYWLLACLNTSIGRADESANNLGIPFNPEVYECQMPMFDAIAKLYKRNKS